MVSQVYTTTNNTQKIVGPVRGFSSYNPLFTLMMMLFEVLFLHVLFIQYISQEGYG